MSETISLMFDENGYAKIYDDTFDITIHCESEEEHNKVLEILNREEKTGKWITEDMFGGDETYYRCSECNELFWIESGTPKDNEYNFCPNCGARMVSE